MKKKKTINAVNTTFLKITQVMEVVLAVTAVEAKNDDHYVIWISKKGVLFFEIFFIFHESIVAMLHFYSV